MRYEPESDRRDQIVSSLPLESNRALRVELRFHGDDFCRMGGVHPILHCFETLESKILSTDTYKVGLWPNLTTL